jgi:hypothetical protein
LILHLIIQEDSFFKRPNGMAQAQRRNEQDPLALSHDCWKSAAYLQRRSRCRLEPVLDGINLLVAIFLLYQHPGTISHSFARDLNSLFQRT